MPGQNSIANGRKLILLLPHPLEPAQKGLLTMFHGQADCGLCCIHGLEVDLARWEGSTEKANSERSLHYWSARREMPGTDRLYNEIALTKLESCQKPRVLTFSVCTSLRPRIGICFTCNRRSNFIAFPALVRQNAAIRLF